MKTITFDPINGTPIADGKVLDFAENLPDECTVSNEIVIDAIRYQILKGRHKHDEVQIVFEGETFSLNEYANFDLHKRPNDFLCLSNKIAEGTLRIQIAMRKNRK